MPLQLSIVIPAYDEEARLGGTLRAIDEWAASRDGLVEVVVVDDGSTDATLDVARTWAQAEVGVSHRLPVVLAEPHRGKGAAVARGMLAARGAVRLFMDADLAVPLVFVERIVEEIRRGADVVIGSRELAQSQRFDEPWRRHALGRGFNWLIGCLGVGGFSDTQCGFKGFSADAAEDVFNRVRLYPAGGRTIEGERVTAFDVELLAISRRRGWQVVEVPIEWRHVPISKVRPLADAVLMLLDVLKVRWHVARGSYD
ncbi:MAG: glycosyltransferase family 2 protein [Chloroflexi bacterium]|nr:glycosyltransferase family 2 protein [Chloroflexota bacterium]